MTRTGPGWSVGLVSYNLLCNKFHVTASNYGEDLPACLPACRMPHATLPLELQLGLQFRLRQRGAAAVGWVKLERLQLRSSARLRVDSDSAVSTLPTEKQLP